MRFVTSVAIGAIAAAGVVVAGPAPAQDKPTVVMVENGGTWQEAVRKALWEPIFAKLGYNLREDSFKSIAEVRLQVQGGRPVWDVLATGIGECVAGEAEGLWEPIDYSVVTNAMDLPASLRGKTWVGGVVWATYVLAWNKNKYKAAHPESWADFFDFKKFPGVRGAYNAPRFMLEAAVLADGVPKDKMYPIDLDRAFRKLAELKQQKTVWYSSFGQGIQLMKDGEVDMLPVFDGRAMDVIDDGAPWEFTYNQGVTNAGCEAIIKGAPHKDAAMKVLNELIDPVIQANLPKYMKYGPINPKAFATGLIAPEVARRMNSHPENMKLQAQLDASWWGQHHKEAQLRWDQFMKN